MNANNLANMVQIGIRECNDRDAIIDQLKQQLVAKDRELAESREIAKKYEDRYFSLRQNLTSVIEDLEILKRFVVPPCINRTNEALAKLKEIVGEQ